MAAVTELFRKSDLRPYEPSPGLAATVHHYPGCGLAVAFLRSSRNRFQERQEAGAYALPLLFLLCSRLARCRRATFYQRWLNFQEGTVAVEKKKGEPEQQEAEDGIGESGGCSAAVGKTVDERVYGALPDAVTVRTVNFCEEVGKQGVAANDLQGECKSRAARAAGIEEQVEEREQKNAPAAAPQDGSCGVDVLDEGRILLQ